MSNTPHTHSSTNPPALYRSPSGSFDFETHSRGSSNHLLSPLPDLTDTVNALTEGYPSANSIPTDQIWPTSPYFGYTNNYGSNAAFDAGQYEITKSIVPEVKPYSAVLLSEAGAEERRTGAEKPHKSGSDATQTSAPNPFANMSTAMLQSYLAGDIQFPFDNQTYTATQGSRKFSAEQTTTLFQQPMSDNNVTPVGPLVERSPSPLVELECDSTESDSSGSPTLCESEQPHRRASDGSQPTKSRAHLRRLSAHLPMEEKLLRAKATEGLSKQDKRRVQNKLAQRAFRARSKVANRNVFSRLEHLEELTEEQANRIVKLSELVNRLQKENTGLKAIKFEEALQKMTNV